MRDSLRLTRTRAATVNMPCLTHLRPARGMSHAAPRPPVPALTCRSAVQLRTPSSSPCNLQIGARRHKGACNASMCLKLQCTSRQGLALTVLHSLVHVKRPQKHCRHPCAGLLQDIHSHAWCNRAAGSCTETIPIRSHGRFHNVGKVVYLNDRRCCEERNSLIFSRASCARASMRFHEVI